LVRLKKPVYEAAELRDEDGNFLDVLNWACQALGWLEEGRPVLRSDAPGPKAWALFQWAQTDTKSRKEFFTLWASASKKASGEDTGEAVEVARQEGELMSMLQELQ
jgi:hypothetical protein